MNWKKDITVTFAQALQALTNPQLLPPDTRIVIREGAMIHVWTVSETILQDITSAIHTSPVTQVEFWVPDN